MAENKELGLDSLKNVNWLNDNASAPSVSEDTSDSETTDTTDNTVEEVVEKTNTESVEEESPQDFDTEQTEQPEQTEQSEEPVADTSAEPEEQEMSVIDTLTQRLGYEVEGDFSDDYDGLEKYTSAVAAKIAEEQLSGIFDQYPDVREYFQYRANNGDPLKYFQAQQAEMDYQSLEITDNTAIQRRIIHDGMRMQGFDDAAISKMSDAYEDAGILKDNAEVYLQQLQKSQKTRKQELLEQQETQAAQQRQQAQEYWATVAKTVETGNLKGLQIPTRQRKQFYDWMTSPVDKSGSTQRDLDRSNLDTESALALEYLIYQGFDLNKLSQNVANTQKTKSLKAKLQSAPSASTRMKSRSKSTVSKAVSLPSLRDLL
jgi:hypothetical protein